MQQSKHTLMLLLPALILAPCIKTHEPVTASLDANKLVVSGGVTDQDGNRKITISMTSPINKPETIPIPGYLIPYLKSSGNSIPWEYHSDNPLIQYYHPRMENPYQPALKIS